MAETNQNLRSRVESLSNQVAQMSVWFENLGFNIQAIAQDQYKRNFKTLSQPKSILSMTRAMCVDTIDPWKENRVRFYHPMLHDPDSDILGLPFASPISPMGGFDDSGLTWVPPASSILCIVFEAGNREAPFYLGTTWNRSRGPNAQDFDFNVGEYYDIWNGTRTGYLVGPDDESQVLPPWNTENYNGTDIDQLIDFFFDTEAQKKITYPHIYGFKTPGKHMLKMVDGNHKCDNRWARMELLSITGNWMIFKDDPLHYCGQWSNKKCNPNPGGEGIELCSEHKEDQPFLADRAGDQPFFSDLKGEPIEMGAECEGKLSSSKIIGGHPSTPDDPETKYVDSNMGVNEFFKNKNECRPYTGPQTPQNNRCDLPQAGMQLLSTSGHSFKLDDSVEEPSGIPNHQRASKPFDFGCNDKFLGLMLMKSATGHAFFMSDIEEDTKLRGENNYIKLLTATGNRIELNDHTIGEPDQDGCPPNLAGPERGIHIQSTSDHLIRLNDNLNEQCGPARMEGGQPENKATQAYVQIRSGYGLETRYSDDFSQQETQSQWIETIHPQRARGEDEFANVTRGPHILRFQGRPEGEPGLVFLRAGGISIRDTYDEDFVFVGDRQENPSDKFTYVSKNFVTHTEDVYFHLAGDKHILFAENFIFLLAGKDCPPSDEESTSGDLKGVPCAFPVIIARAPWTCPLTGQIHWTDKAVSETLIGSGLRG